MSKKESQGPIDVSIGTRVKRLRIDRGMTQEDLAAQMGWSQTSLSNYELGHHPWRVADLARIANIMGISLAELVWPVNEPVPSRNEIESQPPLGVQRIDCPWDVQHEAIAVAYPARTEIRCVVCRRQEAM